jgi:3-oxoadipate enol-lactonase
MGGRIAMRTALLHPARVATLTLVDTHEGFAAFTAEQRRAFVDSRRAPLLAGMEPSDIAEPVARSLIGPHATAEHLDELRRSIASLHKASYIKSLEATVAQVDLGDISAITAPAHFIVGEDDPLTPPTMHHDMAAKLGGAPVSVLPRAGHLSNIENPDAFNQAALRWLIRRRGLGAAPTKPRFISVSRGVAVRIQSWRSPPCRRPSDGPARRCHLRLAPMNVLHPS